MEKIELTTELWKKLKEWRLQHNIKAKDLADHIGKSPAYISKLESGDIKRIERELLEKIVAFISGDSNSYENFMQRVIEDQTNDETKQKMRFVNFDTIERVIPIPPSLQEFIKTKMQELRISSEELCNYINLNEDLDEDFFISNSIDKSTVTYNIWLPYTGTNDKGEPIDSSFILMKCDCHNLDAILSGEVTKSNYTLIFAIIYHLLKHENISNCNNIEKDILYCNAESILRNHKFYSLSELNKYYTEINSKAEFKKLLSDFDLRNSELASKFIRKIHYISDYDVEYANEKLTGIIANTNIDPAFAFAYMAIPLKPVKNISPDQKRELLQQISDLIINFAENSMVDKKMELY